MTNYKTNKKTLRAILSIVLCAFIICAALPSVYAEDNRASTEMLITVGNKTVTNHMGMADVKAMFGNPKVDTVSAYGGEACTFYDDDYSNYLYLETNSYDQIVCYGSVSQDFKTSKYAFGKPCKDYMACREYGTDNLRGIVEYNYEAKTESDEDFKKKFINEAEVYMKSLCLHAIPMFNVLSKLYGGNTPLYYDDEIYERCLQLSENGFSANDYAYRNSKSGYCRLMTSSILTPYYKLNPLIFAENACERSISDDCRIAGFTFYEYGENKYFYTACSVSPELFKKQTVVPMTDKEKNRYKAMCKLYRNTYDMVNNFKGEYFDVEPSFDNLPIVPGKVNGTLNEVALNTINVARIGAGLNEFTIDNSLCEKAQAKAAYTMYLSKNNISNPTPHYPPQAEGITDDFYSLCMPAGAENLFFGEVTSSIIHALDDGNGDSVWCGHRYNLLGNTGKFGIGVSGNNSINSQGVHEFSDYSKPTEEFVCWPSNGVTPLQLLYRDSFTWTVKSVSDYSFDNEVEVEVTLLNNGKKRVYNSSSENFNVSSNIISFNDNNLVVSNGQVYEVVLHNIKGKNGNRTDYKYRSVIADVMSNNNYSDCIVTLSDTGLDLGIGKQHKLKTKVEYPDGNFYGLIEWESSDPSVVEVSNCGVLTAKGVGLATITVSCDGADKAICNVTVKEEKPTIPTATNEQTQATESKEETTEYSMPNFTEATTIKPTNDTATESNSDFSTGSATSNEPAYESQPYSESAVVTEPNEEIVTPSESKDVEITTDIPASSTAIGTFEPATKSTVPVTSQPLTNRPTEGVTVESTESFETEPVTVALTEPTIEKPGIASTDPNESTQLEPKETEKVAKKSNTINVSVKKKSVNLKKLRKKTQKIKALTVRKAQGSVTFKLVKSGITKKIRKLVKINSKGVITIKKWKKAKKGTYKIKVKITASGNAKYNSKTITKKVTIRVK